MELALNEGFDIMNEDPTIKDLLVFKKLLFLS